MTAQSQSQRLAEDVADMLATALPVRRRRMFSGVGLFSDGLMFALVVDGVLYLKADAETQELFAREGLAAFTYARQGNRSVALSYWRAPERLLDEPDELADWANLAMRAARRAAAQQKRREKRQPPR
ncbi:MAG: TfoX/Sxy family protein [Hyphomicrobiaceae bacterium]